MCMCVCVCMGRQVGCGMGRLDALQQFFNITMWSFAFFYRVGTFSYPIVICQSFASEQSCDLYGRRRPVDYDRFYQKATVCRDYKAELSKFM